jgi:hypothetical protein
LTIASETLPTVLHASVFSADGRFIAWGNTDGMVSVCDLIEVQRRLAEVRMGW